MTTAEPPPNYPFFWYQQAELVISLDARKHAGMTAVILSKWTTHKNGDPASGLAVAQGFVVSC